MNYCFKPGLNMSLSRSKLWNVWHKLHWTNSPQNRLSPKLSTNSPTWLRCQTILLSMRRLYLCKALSTMEEMEASWMLSRRKEQERWLYCIVRSVCSRRATHMPSLWWFTCYRSKWQTSQSYLRRHCVGWSLAFVSRNRLPSSVRSSIWLSVSTRMTRLKWITARSKTKKNWLQVI